METKIKCKNFEECGEYLTEKQIKRKKKYHSHPCALKVVSKENYHFIKEYLQDPKNKEELSKRNSIAGKLGYETLIEWRKNNPEKYIEQRRINGKKSSLKNWNDKETREKIIKGISEALKGNKNPLGYKHTEETKKLLSKSKIGNNFGSFAIWTDERRDKQSIKMKETTERLISEGNHTLQKLKKVHYSEDKFATMHPYLKRQFGFKRFLFDFYDEKTNTDIEIDGSIHLREDRAKHDIERDFICKEAGFNVIRIPAKVILQNEFIEWRILQ